MATDASAQSATADSAPSPLANGDHAPDADMSIDSSNEDSFLGQPVVSTTETTLNLKESVPDPNPAGPTPTEDMVSGIQPVADFVPKEAPNLSHPTPPPEDTLISDTNMDTEMTNADGEAQTQESAPPDPLLVTEPSLVRQREEDDDDDDGERAAKRTRTEESGFPLEFSPLEATKADSTHPDVTAVMLSEVDESVTQPAREESNGREPDKEAAQPAAAHAQTPASAALPEGVPASATKTAAVSEQPPESEVRQSVEEKSDPKANSTVTAAKPSTSRTYSTEPMTQYQRAALGEKMKNLKKTKHSGPFLKPVDYVALNIPTYPDIIKQPMDLGTMDSKLKAGEYPSVQAFMDDFNLIIQNCRKFNGDNHAITVLAFNMEAYLHRVMEGLPGPNAEAAPPKQPKRASPAVKSHPRREPRAPSAVAPQSSNTQSFAPKPDGVPQARRESADQNRPRRAIKPPQSREISYGKPKRKEHQLELRFCEHVLDEIKSPKLWHVNNVFMTPVDPVALNIPNYFQVIKKPMDLSTMTQKVKQGEYAKASEFKADFELMINNCLSFNPVGNPVRDLGIELRRHFESLWKDKEKWERQHKPASMRASESAEEESEDDDEDDDDDKKQQIKALQAQLAHMQSMIADLGGVDGKATKSKKSKSKSGDKKKYGSTSAIPKTKTPAPKPSSKKTSLSKGKQVTYEEKQEISEAVGRMTAAQQEELTKIITENCAKYRDMDEMELEIDDLPNDVQRMLLAYVHRLFGRPNRARFVAADSPPDDGAAEDDEEYIGERARGGGGGAGKRKKHKPMGSREQEQTIANLQDKLSQFHKVTSGSESPNTSSYNMSNMKAESSGDEESEESEEE